MESEVNGPLLVGPVVRVGNITTGEILIAWAENAEAFMALNQRYLVRRHDDGWFVDGARHRAQIWEYGPGRLGVTATGRRLVSRCAGIDWLKGRGIGDEEANFNCPWDSEHLERLDGLLKLQRRHPPAARRQINPHTGRFESKTMLPSVQPLTPA